jgi:ABC-type nitrate/sulfonate/bicarbonate transport system permease component
VLKSTAWALGGFGAFLLCWWLFGLSVEAVRHIPFPMPKDVLMRVYLLFQGESIYDTSLFSHFMMSLKRWMIAYCIATFCGIVLGVLCGFFEKAYKVGLHVSTVLQMMPGLAWIPFAMILFGIGERATLFMIAMSAFPPIFIHTASALRSISPQTFLMAKMMNLSSRRLFFTIIMPSIALSLLTGLRLGLAIGWRVLIAAEMVVGSSVGLGYTIIQSRWSLDFEVAFISIGLICLVGIVAEKWVFGVLEQKVAKRVGNG